MQTDADEDGVVELGGLQDEGETAGLSVQPGQTTAVRLAAMSYCLGFFSLGLLIASLGPSFLALAKQTDSSVEALSVCFAVRSAGYLLGSIVGGIMVDRFPGHPVLCAVLFFTGIGTALIPSVHSVLLLAALVFMQGLAMGALDTLGNVLLIWQFGGDPGPWMQALHCLFGLGAVLSPLLVRWSMEVYGSVDAAFLIFAGVCVAASLACGLLPSPAIRQPGGAAGGRGTSRSQYCVVGMAALFLGCYVGCETGYGGFVLLFSHNALGASEATGQLYTATFWGCIALGRLIAIPLAAWVSPQRILVADLVLSTLCAAALAAWTSADSLWVVSAGFGLGMASIFPTVVSVMETYLDVSGTIATLFCVGASTGEMLIPVGLGLGIELISPRVFTLGILGCCIAQCIICVGLFVLGAELTSSSKQDVPYSVATSDDGFSLTEPDSRSFKN